MWMAYCYMKNMDKAHWHNVPSSSTHRYEFFHTKLKNKQNLFVVIDVWLVVIFEKEE